MLSRSLAPSICRSPLQNAPGPPSPVLHTLLLAKKKISNSLPGICRFSRLGVWAKISPSSPWRTPQSNFPCKGPFSAWRQRVDELMGSCIFPQKQLQAGGRKVILTLHYTYECSQSSTRAHRNIVCSQSFRVDFPLHPSTLHKCTAHPNAMLQADDPCHHWPSPIFYVAGTEYS